MELARGYGNDSRNVAGADRVREPGGDNVADGAVTMERRADLDRLYGLLEQLRARVGGVRYLAESDGRMGWPKRGVYFFFEPGELREDGRTARVVRVGTHAVSAGSKSTLWGRLSQHRGRVAGGGNHRGSIFRLHVGSALLARHPERYGVARTSWGIASSADRPTVEGEHELERDVSAYIGRMAFLWLEADDEPGTGSVRSLIERNVVGLLSNYERQAVDASSAGWLGRSAARAEVRGSGLWNVNYVAGGYDRAGLDAFERLVERVG